MFAIAVPSTIVLTMPVEDGGDPVPYATLSFTHLTDDVSKCKIIVVLADGHMHEVVFNTQGSVVEQRYTSAEEIEQQREAEKAVEEKRAEHDRVTAEARQERELETADDTTERDVSWDAPHLPPEPLDPVYPAAVADPAPQPVRRVPAGLRPAGDPHG